MKRQDTRYFEVDEGYRDEVLESAKENGVTAIYSDGTVKLEGSVGDIKDVEYDTFEMYDEEEVENERNRTAPIKGILDRVNPEEASLSGDWLEESDSNRAVADGGEKIESPTQEEYSQLGTEVFEEDGTAAAYGPNDRKMTDGGRDDKTQTMAEVDHTSDVRGPQKSMR